MLKFSQMLRLEHHPNFKIDEIYPKPVISNFIKQGKLRKWAAYTDKYLIFKNRVMRRLQNNHDLIHITDHSNAVYVNEIKRFSNASILVTCHDLIAIRQAKDEFEKAPKTSKTGKFLQSWILNSLNGADYFACDSNQTLKDLNRLIPESCKRSEIIYLGTDSTERIIDRLKKDSKFDAKKENFVIHVGSAAWYKNRKAVFRSFINARTILPKNNLKLVLVGPVPQKEELDAQMSNWIKSNPNAIHSLQNLTENTLAELYNYAKALVFPSFIEGFGWPPLEAAVRGCPVISTRTGAIADLLGNYAKYVEAKNQSSIDQSVQELLRSPGSKMNAMSLPTHEDCRRQYFDLYEQMMVN
ncbi:glycosyltransferase [Opitutales bacterium]|nr:glycosyltransferase [Opitutales bacterium]